MSNFITETNIKTNSPIVNITTRENKIYYVYLYVDTDNDYYFKKSNKWKDNKLTAFFKNRKSAGEFLLKEFQTIYETLSETTPDYVKETFNSFITDGASYILGEHDQNFETMSCGNSIIIWKIKTISPQLVVFEDTKEEEEMIIIEEN